MGEDDDEGVITQSALEREQAFAAHTTDVETSEEIPGVYGTGIVRDVKLHHDVDEYVLEAPDGTETVLRFDANPSTKRCRTYAFLELLDVASDRQLDAVGRRVPFVYVRETDEWIPAFPGRNRFLAHGQFAILPVLLRFGLYELMIRDDSEDHPRPDPHFEMRAWLFWALFLAISAVAYLTVLGSGLLAGVTALVVGALGILTIFMTLERFLFVRCGTVSKFDSEAIDTSYEEHGPSPIEAIDEVGESTGETESAVEGPPEGVDSNAEKGASSVAEPDAESVTDTE